MQMSVQEIKHQIDLLTVEEQLQLESFLRAKRVAESAHFQQRIEEAHRRMNAGEGVSSIQLRTLLAQQHSATS
jgi:hypothetical protein